MTLRAVVRGVGHYLPARIVENSEFEATLDTSDAWIRSRSGIERRHFATEGDTTSSMATAAAKAALADAGLAVDDVDAIVLATSTADLTFPSAATMVQSQLGMTRGFAFDVQAVCAGFVYALANANALIVSGQANRVIVLGDETFQDHGLERPQHLRAVRRRRGRAGAGGAGRCRHQAGQGHSGHRSAL